MGVWFDLLRDPVVGNASVIELVWLLSNAVGIAASLIMVVLAMADQRRVELRRRRANVGTTVLAEIAVLGNAAAHSELIKAIIHIGHGATGLIVSAAPEPVRAPLSAALIFVTVWLLSSSWLILLSTLLQLKARYDYREVRATGKRKRWVDVFPLALSEFWGELKVWRKKWQERTDEPQP